MKGTEHMLLANEIWDTRNPEIAMGSTRCLLVEQTTMETATKTTTCPMWAMATILAHSPAYRPEILKRYLIFSCRDVAIEEEK